MAQDLSELMRLLQNPELAGMTMPQDPVKEELQAEAGRRLLELIRAPREPVESAQENIRKAGQIGMAESVGGRLGSGLLRASQLYGGGEPEPSPKIPSPGEILRQTMMAQQAEKGRRSEEIGRLTPLTKAPGQMAPEQRLKTLLDLQWKMSEPGRAAEATRRAEEEAARKGRTETREMERLGLERKKVERETTERARGRTVGSFELSPDAALIGDNERAKVINRESETERLQARVEEALGIIRESGGSVPVDPAKRKKFSAAATSIMLSLKNTEGLGVLSGPDLGILESMTGDPLSWSSKMRELFGGGEISGVLQGIKSRAQRELVSMAAPWGLIPRVGTKYRDRAGKDLAAAWLKSGKTKEEVKAELKARGY